MCGQKKGLRSPSGCGCDKGQWSALTPHQRSLVPLVFLCCPCALAVAAWVLLHVFSLTAVITLFSHHGVCEERDSLVHGGGMEHLFSLLLTPSSLRVWLQQAGRDLCAGSHSSPLVRTPTLLC